jgi:ribosome biogenesis GTPase
MAKRRLTQQQKARIARIQEERRQRMAEQAEAALEEAAEGEPGAPQKGRVITRHGRNLVVRDEDGGLHLCLFRQNLGEIVCGDQVVWQATHDSEGVVTARLDRRSALTRPDYSGREKALAANVSQLVIVLAPEPEPTGFLIDQYLVAAEQLGVDAIICLNKADLLGGGDWQAFRECFAHYEDIGYPIIGVSAKREHGLDPLIERLRDQTSILVGQSGVGKSSLVNALIPDQDAQVGRLSNATGLGRHTTSATTLYDLPSGGELIDSPGVRSFRLGQMERAQLEQGFREFRPYLGQCKFKNCAHENEPECAIRAAVAAGHIHPERLANFLNMARNLPTEQH